jgi:hypothetical protein
MRSIVSPAFSLENVRNMNDDIWSIAATLQTTLTSHITERTTHDDNNHNDDDHGDHGDHNDPNSVLVDLTQWSAIASLDVIGRCGFDHDFRLGATTDAQSILSAWQHQASAGMLTSALVALVALRTFPFITSLPIPAIQAQGEIKTTVRKLAQHLVAAANRHTLVRKTDVLSLLCASHLRPTYHLH